MIVLNTLIVLCLVAASTRGLSVQIKPRGDQHDRRLGVSIVYSCELSDNDASDYDDDYADEDEKGDAPVFQWLNPNNKNITAQSGRCFTEDVERGLKLYILKIELEDAGKYTCIIKHRNETVEQSVKLVLYQDIGFENVSDHQNPMIYTDALIHCKVTGNPVPHVSWKYNGKRIRMTGRYQKKDNGLQVKNITKTDDGKYTCRAEVDVDGRYDERIITVDVHVPPRITSNPVIVHVIQGHNISISCQAEGNPLPRYSFTKAKKNVPMFNTDLIVVNEQDGVLHFLAINKSDEGSYTCRAANVAGMASIENKIKVLVPAAIHEWSNTTVEEHQPLTIMCEAHGDPPPEMHISRNGIIYFTHSAASNNSVGYDTMENGTMKNDTMENDTMENDSVVVTRLDTGELMLQIDSTGLDDAGVYTCTARNSIGFHEREASVTVYFKPRLSDTNDLEVYSWPGAKHNLTCQSFGLPTPIIKWQRWDTTLVDNKSYKIYTFSDENSTTSSLEVSPTTADIAWIFGEPSYFCHVDNLVGSVIAEFHLKEATPPDSPEGLNVVERLADGLILEVAAPLHDGGDPVSGYSIEYSEKPTKRNKSTPTHNDTDQTDEGDEKVNSTKSIVINKIDNQTERDNETAKDIHDDNQNKTGIQQNFTVHNLTFEGNRTEIYNLKPDTCYLFKIRARNIIGSSQEFETTVKTAKQSPPRIIQITSEVYSVKSDGYLVTWTVNSTGGAPILEYHFHYTKINPHMEANESDPSTWTVRAFEVGSKKEASKAYELSGLSPGSTYVMSIKARNAAGWSLPTSPFKFTTAEVMRQLPPIVSINGAGRSTLSAQVLGVSLANAAVAIHSFICLLRLSKPSPKHQL